MGLIAGLPNKVQAIAVTKNECGIAVLQALVQLVGLAPAVEWYRAATSCNNGNKAHQPLGPVTHGDRDFVTPLHAGVAR